MALPRTIPEVYDMLFHGAEAIARRGQEHSQICARFAATKDGYKAIAFISLAMSDKDGIATALDAIVRGADEMELVVHISEAWRRTYGAAETPDLSRPVKEQPGAHEAVLFMFFREGEVWTAACPVDHKAHTLTKGELIKVKVGDVTGRFVPRHTR